MFRKRLLTFGVIVVFLGVFAGFSNYSNRDGVSRFNNEYVKESAFVNRVIDGDTIELKNEETIRLLGINTPERGKYYYNEAKDFLQEINGKNIETLRDFEDVGYRGRKLRYIFEGSRFFNVEILEKGLGTSYMLDDLKYKEKLIDAENFAKDNEIGLWEKSSSDCVNHIELVELNAGDEYFILRNNYNSDCDLSGWIIKDNANHFFKLDGLKGGELRKYESNGNIWNNNGDRFFMRDDVGKLVLFYEY